MVLVPGAPEDAFNELTNSRLLEIKANLVAFEKPLNVIMSLCAEIAVASGTIAIIGAEFPLTYALNTRKSSGVVSKHIVDYILNLAVVDTRDTVLTALGSLPTDVLQVVANSVSTLVPLPKIGASTTDKDLKTSAEELVKRLVSAIRETRKLKEAAIRANSTDFKDSLFAGFMADLNAAQAANSFKKLNEVKKLIEDITSNVSALSSGSVLDPWELVVSQSSRATGETESTLRAAYDDVQRAYGGLIVASNALERIQGQYAAAIAKCQANIAVLADKPEWRAQIQAAEDVKVAAVNEANNKIISVTTEKLALEQTVLQKETAKLTAEATAALKKAASDDAVVTFDEAKARQNAAETAANPKFISGPTLARYQETLRLANNALNAANAALKSAKEASETADEAAEDAADALSAAKAAVESKQAEVLTAIETKNAVIKASDDHIASVRKTIAESKTALIIVQNPETYNATIESRNATIEAAQAAYDLEKKNLDLTLVPKQAAVAASVEKSKLLVDAKAATDIYLETVKVLKASAISPDSAEFKAEATRLEGVLTAANKAVADAEKVYSAKQTLLLKAQADALKANADVATAEAGLAALVNPSLEVENTAKIAVNNAKLAYADARTAENDADTAVNEADNDRNEAKKDVITATQASNVHAGGLALQIVAAYSEYTKSLPTSMSVTNKAQSGPVVVITLTSSDFNFFKDSKNEEAEYVSASSKYQLVRGYLEKDLEYFTAELTTAQNGIDSQLLIKKVAVDNAKSALEAYLSNNLEQVAFDALNGVLRDQDANVGPKVLAKENAKRALDAALTAYGNFPSPKIIGGIKGLRNSIERIVLRQKTA